MPLNVEYSTGSVSKLTLADVRALVAATQDWDPATEVKVSRYDSQRDGSSSSMSVKLNPRLDNAPKQTTCSYGGRPDEFL